MSVQVPREKLSVSDLDSAGIPFVGGPATAAEFPLLGRASEEVRSGLHAILPPAPQGDQGVETLGRHPGMDLDFDDKTSPYIDVGALMEQAAQPVGDRPEADDFDDKTDVAPNPKFPDLEETLDEFPVLGEGDEVDNGDDAEPVTERKPGVGVPDNGDDHNKETWPKIPAAFPVTPNGLGSVDQGTDAFREAVVKALTTDPDGDFAPVGDDEFEIV